MRKSIDSWENEGGALSPRERSEIAPREPRARQIKRVALGGSRAARRRVVTRTERQPSALPADGGRLR
jgi:hypothetical protein